MKSIIFSTLLFACSIISFSQDRLKLLSTLPMPGVSWDIWGYYDENTGKEYALVGSNGLTIVDISDAANPQIVSNVTGVAEFDHKVWKNYVYTVTGNGVSGGFGHIIDIADPTNPVVVDSFRSAHNLFIDSMGYMYASNPGVIIYDLNADPTKPDSIWGGGFEGHDVTVVGNTMYDFHGRGGTNIYDVTDKYKPVLLSHIEHPDITYHHQGWPTRDGKYLLICDELAKDDKDDVSVWDISDLENPDRVSGFADNTATIHNVFVLNDWVYSSYYAAGVRMFDISDPLNLAMTDEYDTTPDLDEEGYAGVFGIYPYALNKKVLASDRSKGLYIFEFDSTRQKNNSLQIKVEVAGVHNSGLNLRIDRGNVELQDRNFYVEVFNVIGQLIYEEHIFMQDIFQKKIHLSDVSRGDYVIRVWSSEVDTSQHFYVN